MGDDGYDNAGGAQDDLPAPKLVGNVLVGRRDSR